MDTGFHWLSFAGILTIAQALRAQDPDVSGLESGVDVQAGIYQDIPQFGGPTSVSGQLAEDNVVAPQFRCPRLQQAAEPWFHFKERLNDHFGL